MFFECNLTIERIVDAARLVLPDEEQAASEDGLNENHSYSDIRGVSRAEAQEVIDDEWELLDRIATADESNQDDIVEEIEDALREDMHPLAGYDLGVGGLVFALSSVGCIPISSCNGGVVGGSHAFEHPWLIFYAPVVVVDTLLMAAEQENVGMLNYEGGMLEIFSNSVLSFNRMASLLVV